MYLATDRLIIRDWNDKDINDLYDYAKHEEVGPNAGWPPHKSIQDSKNILEMFLREGDSFAIEYKEIGKVIGGIGLHQRIPDDSLAHLMQKEIGYVLHPDYWGCGIVPEAVRTLIEYGFQVLELDLVWCGHYDFNHKSKRVVQKSGFHYAFTETKKLTLLDNQEVEMLYYKLTKDEFQQHR